MDFDVFLYTFMFIVVFLAGIVNTFAGDASIFTLSTLLLFNLPATVTNGTNRLGILVQNFAVSYIFYKDEKLSFRKSIRFIIPSLLGVIIGAKLAVKIDEEILGIVVRVLVRGGGLLLMMLNPKREYKVGSQEKKMNEWLNFALFCAIGFYQ